MSGMVFDHLWPTRWVHCSTANDILTSRHPLFSQRGWQEWKVGSKWETNGDYFSKPPFIPKVFQFKPPYPLTTPLYPAISPYVRWYITFWFS